MFYASFALIVAILVYIKIYYKFSIVQFVTQSAIALLVTLLFYSISYFGSGVYDVELWNGSISGKEYIQRNCPSGRVSSKDNFCDEYHSFTVYVGQTCTGTGKDQVCVSNYATEYEYDFPWERKWFVYAKNIGLELKIDKVDRQGRYEPPAYTAINVGDPASKYNEYKNWVKAASDSIFYENSKEEEKYKDSIPLYPDLIYDYIKVNRIITVDAVIDNLKEMNRYLSDALIVLGPNKQMNAIFVIVDGNKYDIDYAYAVRRAWKGFKKNDAVVFIGLNDNKAKWVEVLSWSKASIFNIQLRDKIMETSTNEFSMKSAIDYLKEIGMNSYERRSMKEFEFLKDEIKISPWIYILMYVSYAIAIFASTKLINNHNKIFM